MNKLAKSLLRPFYKAFLEKPIWWFLSRVKTYFFSEIGVQLGNMEQHIGRDAIVQAQRFSMLEARAVMLEEKLRQAEVQNAAQWDALEQLLLAILGNAAKQRSEYLDRALTSSDRIHQADAWHQ